MRNFLHSLFAITLSIFLTACGGGGGGGGGGSSTPAFTTTTTSSGDNTHPIVVDGGPEGIANLAFTSVTVCIPGTNQCRTIDDVIVDTGSVGLRLISSAAGSLNLPAQLAATNNPLFTCVEFVDNSYAWGAVRRADVKLSNYTASDIPIQIIGGTGSNLRPASCGSGDIDDDLSNVASMGGNGIIGIGHRRQDCGINCTVIATYGDYYFSCGNSSCTPSIVAIDAQIKNPIALFPSDNNGVIIDLPAVSSSGAPSVTGSMIFGIGTRNNNSLNSATIYTTSSGGYLTTSYNSVDYSESFIDSGSNGLFFPDTMTRCPGFEWFYCPSSTRQKDGKITGLNNNSANIVFNVANAAALNFNFHAFNNLAGYASDYFDWGLPFFYGRKVYTGFETDPQGPFTAF